VNGNIEKEFMSALEVGDGAFPLFATQLSCRGIPIDFRAVIMLLRPRITLNMRWIPVKPRVSYDSIPLVAGGRANDAQFGWASRFYPWQM
jgi:hypothetical protein